MGEAKRRRELGSVRKEKLSSTKRGHKALRETAVEYGFKKGKITVINGMQYFKDPVTGLTRKVGPKLRKIMNARKKAEEARLEQEFLARKEERKSEE